MSQASDDNDPKPPGESPFPQTRWSLVIAAGNKDDKTRAALSELCESYWYPIYSYLRRSRSDADSKDMTQGFFEGLLRRNDLERLTTERGKFRTFLLTALKHFMTNLWRHETAQRRGAGAMHLSIDYLLAEKRYDAEPALDVTPEKLYEVRYANTLFEIAMDKLRLEFRQKQKEDVFDDLLPFLVPNSRSHSYPEIAEQHGCSVGAVRKAVHDLRLKFRDAIRHEVAQTVNDPADVDDEIVYIISIIGDPMS